MDEKCQSCGMPMETGIYCQHCVDEDGQLQDFDTRFERMVGWQVNKGSPRAQAEAETLEYMATMPAWADHPRVKQS
ncbi:hypothetical protein [Maritalea sp.]|uniref:hypothetical protein n=1 Tax=Maritalea sp. TaxID=2003361 RepID=UPI003EF6C822